ncbi:sigma-54-dependent Fis family transcriptional regulator [Bacillus paralicheniformis]|uniref:sigma-54-dependent Fis family transcriptional regulator n=1 Tax=Bacillus TaxID=1386 RepID=UPI0005B577AF|nr:MULTISPECIES: sigma-54-dependent Fis family transcriptional regulator [Bacillus]AJO17102.1 transcriptional regulator [Bacillus paralicheniformis]MBU5330338.1 sigma-54-dependent Fis family transcriptional regulator [Bacillus paralicheniformis]MBU8747689.1 sigma-54-dependent Fis family transcriptional regulator [Bacillus paralicheniformis]MBU8761676.1 sigma-54-dependent Fis family transcriptional regulator [Bacillus paralicheniformis]MCR2017844.1 sigma-54-dependent Fis family transcriptional 
MNPTPCYLNTWKRFVQEGLLDQARLNKRVMESWYRCKSRNVNPYLDKGQSILKKDLFNAQKKKHSLFLDIALPYLHNISRELKESEMMALLIDADGYVLSLAGCLRTLEEAKKINFVEGVRWTETEVGTNAIGTALEIGEAVTIHGTEHFSVASHHWSCSAAPIRDEDGTVMGLIDISCLTDRRHPFMLGMAATAAHAIEREVSVHTKKNEAELISHCLEKIDSDQPFIVCNEKDKIVAASRSVRERFSDWRRMDVNDLYERGFAGVHKQTIFSTKDGRPLGKSMALAEVSRKKTAPSLASGFIYPGETGTSRAFQQALNDMRLAAQTDANVYIWGETGSGKELAARAIHQASARRNGPFIAVNCGAIPESLMESELFGYAEGAFTGAKRRGSKGKFEQAHRGTIFLDEIGEIPYQMQVALLRIIEERKVTPIGGTREVPLDIRIITATHRDLKDLLQKGKIREDLYYRLHVYPVKVPPLRERKEDIPDLFRHYQQQHGWKADFPPIFFNRLQEYHWPGNVRELFNTFERLRVLFPDGGLIAPSQYSAVLDGLHWKSGAPSEEDRLTFRERVQKQTMMEALQKTKGNVSEAAKQAGIPRSTFYKRLRKYNL